MYNINPEDQENNLSNDDDLFPPNTDESEIAYIEKGDDREIEKK
ncbi:hypothetical protein [Albibacterium bauzanense]|uniref:Uncharacterized protein n=1 Tax=Albibacterium bauzanense TaxID=653929 RepID=A0A4R1M4C1_9SPHI|nr:hypothetical protein [Albibacterium bauzanense]TCK85734.1 hypothetical protein C8N28_1046 [Albibacterium bauzanense]